MKTLEQFVNENIYDEDGDLEITIPNRSFYQILDSELSKITGKSINSSEDINAHFSTEEFEQFKSNLSDQLSKEINAYIRGALDVLYSQWVKEIRKENGTAKDIQALKADFDFDMAIYNIRKQARG